MTASLFVLLVLAVIGIVLCIEVGDTLGKKQHHPFDVKSIKAKFYWILTVFALSQIVILLGNLSQSFVSGELGIFAICILASMVTQGKKSD